MTYASTPWKIASELTKNQQRPIFNDEVGVIALVNYGKSGEDDAYLIHAAPDLLEACKNLVAEWDAEVYMEMDPSVGLTGPVYDTQTIKSARLAIAKAKGEEPK